MRLATRETGSDARPCFMLLGNGGHYNRGCQAIELGTYEILRRQFGAFNSIVVSAGYTDECDQAQPFENRNRVPGTLKSLMRLTTWNPFAPVRSLVERMDPTHNWRFLSVGCLKLDSWVRASEAVLAVGGDNFTFDYGYPDAFFAMNERVLGLNNAPPLVLWGCSVGPFSSKPRYERRAAEHLRKIALITAREPATVEYLRSIGVEDNVILVADPAFAMRPVEPPNASVSIPQGAIGINLSSLAGKYVPEDADTWFKRVVDSVRAVCRKTCRPVVLVPHVIGPEDNDDHAFLGRVANEIVGEQVVLLPRELSAPELKWAIGQCEVFIGARTHSTIAALGERVPCGFIAYSQKAPGLSEYVMGSTEHVLHVWDLTPESLVCLVQSLLACSGQVHEYLERRIPEVQASAFSAGERLGGVLAHRGS